jgi:SPP1 family predicted phage head-tail adaptor
MVKAGELNRKITFQHAAIAYNGFNEAIQTWVDGAYVWATVREVGTKELYQAQKIYSETSAVFKIRYTEKVRSNMRIKYGNRIFEILGVPIDPDGHRTCLNIAAKEVI